MGVGIRDGEGNKQLSSKQAELERGCAGWAVMVKYKPRV